MAHFHIPPSWRLPERLATPESVYLDRRQVLRGLGLGTLAMTVPRWAQAGDATLPNVPAAMIRPAVRDRFADRFPAKRNDAYGVGGRQQTPEAVSARYNNFYEFTTDKDRVWQLAKDYEIKSWKVAVRGLVKKPRTLGLDDVFKRFPLEERLYRFRCVERWSMQVPWTGFPLRSLIDSLDPLPSAKYVRFGAILDRKGLPGIASQPWYPWPYYEGLRLDEARNPLAFVVVGSYGHALPMQHGAPWRLAIPWKYGYKGPKSLVEIELTDQQPHTFWNDTTPAEYGFYSNCDPSKPHPRWSQEWEQDIGTSETRETLLYNGYADEVGSLYTGKEV
jgi:methionine sulfoxide reductase catalytic subunit